MSCLVVVKGHNRLVAPRKKTGAGYSWRTATLSLRSRLLANPVSGQPCRRVFFSHVRHHETPTHRLAASPPSFGIARATAATAIRYTLFGLPQLVATYAALAVLTLPVMLALSLPGVGPLFVRALEASYLTSSVPSGSHQNHTRSTPQDCIKKNTRLTLRDRIRRTLVRHHRIASEEPSLHTTGVTVVGWNCPEACYSYGGDAASACDFRTRGWGARGAVVDVALVVPGDAGIHATALCAGEAAMAALALDDKAAGAKTPTAAAAAMPAGFHSPAAALGATLVERMRAVDGVTLTATLTTEGGTTTKCD